MFQTLALRHQLAFGLASVAGCFLVTLAVVAALMSRLADGVEQTAGHSLPMVLAVSQMDLSRVQVQQFLTDVSATGNRTGFDEARAWAERFRQAAQEAQSLVASTADPAAAVHQRAQLSAIGERFEAYRAAGERMAETYLASGQAAGNLQMAAFDAASESLGTELQAFRQQEFDDARHRMAADREAAQQSLLTMAAGAALSSALALGIGVAVVRGVLRLLGAEPRAAAEAVRRMGRGDLAEAVAVQPGDRHSLMAELSAMQRNLNELVRRVHEQSASVALASGEIASGNESLASRTAAHASALQQTAASMVQIERATRDCLGDAQDAGRRAQLASDDAAQGRELVGRFVDTMDRIHEASNKIAEIIGVIDGIAFQTNILALNAAVEAARAGEQGRGFAVVAAEVRSLAGRSAEAARAVKTLVGDSVSRVEEGNAVVSAAREAMSGIEARIREVAATVNAIGSANGQQSSAIAQISQAIGEMDRMTQENAALVEESAGATAGLNRQAQDMAQAVGAFRVAA